MDLTLYNYILMFFLIAFGGFVDSIAGGGGLITVPTYLSLGVPSELILGTNKCVNTTGGFIAIFRYFKSGSINLKLMIFGIIAAIFGSTIGAYLSKYLDSKKMVYILIFVVPVIFVINIKKKKTTSKGPQLFSYASTRPKIQMIVRCVVIGFVIGGYDGFFGPGTGTFLIIALVYFMNMDMIEASPNARAINFTSNISAFLFFLIKGAIAWKIVFVAVIGSIIGNYLGSGFVVKGNLKVVKYVFNFVLVVLLGKSIYDSFYM